MLPDGEKFDGTGYSGFRTKILALAKARGLGGYLDGTIISPAGPQTSATTTQGATQTSTAPTSIPLPPDPTPVYSITLSHEEFTHRDASAVALLVLNVKNPVGLGLKTDGTAAEALKSLDDNFNKKTGIGLVNALRELHNAYLVPGTPMLEHVARVRELWQTANDMGAGITDDGFRTIFISLLGEEWDMIVPVLYTFTTSAEVISFVTMHAERLNRVPSSSNSSPASALVANTFGNRDARRAARRNLVCSNPQCGAQGRKGHTIADCFWPGGGKEGQWPAWWKGKRTSVANTVDTIAFSVWTIPEAVVSTYNNDGIQAVDFGGEEVLASPETFLAWKEAADATVSITMPEITSARISTSLEPNASVSDFTFISMASEASDFSFIEGPAHNNTPYEESHGAPQIAAAAVLQAGQPYPGDVDIQEEQRFLVYQISDTQHIIMDDMLDEDVPVPTHYIRDTDLDLVAWYAEHRRRALGVPIDDDPEDWDGPDFDGSNDDDSDDGDNKKPYVPSLAVHALATDTPVSIPALTVVDSGATEHCFRARDDFVEYHPVESREGNAAEGSKFRILATGTVRKLVTYHGQQREILFEAIYTPDIRANLISVSKLDARGYAVLFENGCAVFRRPDGSAVLERVLRGGMYVVDFNTAATNVWTARSRNVPVNKATWHRRLGHIGNTGLETLITGDHVEGLNVRAGEMNGICEDCIMGKHARRPFDGGYEVEKEIGERSYLDLWGLAQVTSVGGKRWLFHISTLR